MRLLIVFCFVTVTLAAPQSLPGYSYNDAQILRYDSENYGTGNYRYAYEQSDGTKAEQQGELKNEGREDEYLVVRGSFTWISPDGVKYTVTYVADENGYKPKIQEGVQPSAGVPPPAIVASLLG